MVARDASALIGFGSLLVGIGLVSVPVSLMVGGGLLLSAALWGHLNDQHHGEDSRSAATTRTEDSGSVD
jgi:hypothetical protein